MRNDKQEQAIRSSAAEYLTFVAATGDSTESMEMRYEDENIWLTQKMMSALYDVDVRTINEHIQKIYEDGELTEEATIRNFRIVQTEGSRQVSRQVKHYNLQMGVVYLPRNTSTTFWSRSGRFGCLNASSTKRSPTSTPRLWIMINQPKPHACFFPRYRTNSTGRSTVILRRS